MAAGINLSRAWTGSTIAPQSGTPASAQIPAAVTNAQFSLGQNQAAQFYNSLLASMLGGFGGGGNQQPSSPVMSPQQGNAINFAIQQMGQEDCNRARQADIRRFASPTPAGVGSLTGVSPLITPLGGGNIPVYNPIAEQFLSSQRLAPSLALGTAAASFGSGAPRPMGGGGMSPMGGSGWVPGYGF